MITRPLELEARLSPAPRDLDFVAWVNAGVIVLFFSLLGSSFVLPPGLPIDLPYAAGGSERSGASSVVVTYRRDNVILFEGGMYTLTELKKHMESYTKNHTGAVMIVRADRQVSMQQFLDLCEMARAVGFANVLVAAEPQTPEDGLK